MSPKKSGGLNFNPLLARTEEPVVEVEEAEEEQAAEPTSTHVDTSTRTQADVSTREHADTQTRKRVGTPPNTSTNKFTFYFTEEELDRLERAWDIARRKSRGMGKRISKSQFVRLGLDLLLDDFDRDRDHVIDLLLQQTDGK